MAGPDQLSAVALVCTLTPSPEESSSLLMASQVLDALREHGVTGNAIRVVDHDVKPGVQRDMGVGDAWPGIRDEIMRADILLIATPTWMGQPSSVCQRVLERLDAELSEKDDQGRLFTYAKLAIGAVVGNEDGAHHITGVLFQALNDVGFTIPAQGVVYWSGEAMTTTDYKNLDKAPDAVVATIKTASANAAHLARALKQQNYPLPG